jgi:hypothetical protein
METIKKSATYEIPFATERPSSASWSIVTENMVGGQHRVDETEMG